MKAGFQTISILFFSLFAVSCLNARDYKVYSPNANIEVTITVEDRIYYSVRYKNIDAVNPSSISLLTDRIELGKNAQVIKANETSVNEDIVPVIKERRALIKNEYRQLELSFNGDYKLLFRVYNDAAAYRFVCSFDRDIKVLNERAEFSINHNPFTYIPFVICRQDADCFHTSFEENYTYKKLSDLPADSIAFLPVLAEVNKGLKIVITEADLYDYPGMFVKASGEKLHGVFSGYPLEETIQGGEFKQLIVTKRADYIAHTKGSRSFPWRVLIFSESDAALADNDIVFKLSEGTEEDFSWVKPGKSTEEWIISRNIYGVDFKSGINTATYKYYIDFASRFNLEYVMLDAGWSVENDLLKVVPEINMHEILDYAKQKNVGIILWCLSLSLKNQMQQALDQFAEWGVKGIMVDFMDRDDQVMVDYYEQILKETSKRKIFVNFHGSFKQTGLQRKYPNQITREGVLGHEFNMWSSRVTPDHNLIIPFIRMIAGPMDYEGGSMQNAQQKDFRAIFEKPMSQGTRTHQLAQYVIYISPLQYLAGNPADYLREPEFTSLLASIPTVWDESIAIDGSVSDYLVMARKKGDDWFIASLNDWEPKTIEISLDFLDNSEYNAVICKDGINADKYASDYKIEKEKFTKGNKIKIQVAPGGGWFAHLKK